MNSDTRTKDTRGTLMMLGASFCFSLGGILLKIIPWNPFAINGVRNLIAACVIGLYIFFTHHRMKFNFTVFMGAVCMAGVTTMFAIANKLTTAGNAIVLQYSMPIWLILLMFLFFRKKPSRLEVITIALVLIGILCFFFDSLSTGRIAGDLIALFSGLFYAGMFMLNQFEKGDALSSMVIGQFLCGICLSPMVLRETVFTPPVLAAVFVLGSVQVGLAYILFSIGTRYTNPIGTGPESDPGGCLLRRSPGASLHGRCCHRCRKHPFLQYPKTEGIRYPGNILWYSSFTHSSFIPFFSKKSIPGNIAVI